MANKYPLKVGEADRVRLEILNKMYNPLAQYFLLQNGLKPGMTILEIGCGAGDMACWLGKQVGPNGKVVAIDNSQEQINLSAAKAESNGINNIEFICLDVNEVEQLGQQFDMTYGRWVIFFAKNAESVFGKLANILKPSGVLTYETALHVGEGDFTVPNSPIVRQWFDICFKFFCQNELPVNFGAQLYNIYQNLNLESINLLINQPIMTTAEEKSVMRLGSLSIKHEILKFMTEEEYAIFISKLETFEQSSAIAGFFRNVLAAGVKK